MRWGRWLQISPSWRKVTGSAKKMWTITSGRIQRSIRASLNGLNTIRDRRDWIMILSCPLIVPSGKSIADPSRKGRKNQAVHSIRRFKG